MSSFQILVFVLLFAVFPQMTGQCEIDLRKQGGADLTQLFADARSTAIARRQAAEAAILDLGPGIIFQIRQEAHGNRFLQDVVDAHDALVQGEINGVQTNDPFIAVRYFIKRGAVAYYVLPLTMKDPPYPGEILDALSRLDSTQIDKHEDVILVALISFMEHRSPQPQTGGEEVAAYLINSKRLYKVLIRIGLISDGDRMEFPNLIARAKERLSEFKATHPDPGTSGRKH